LFYIGASATADLNPDSSTSHPEYIFFLKKNGECLHICLQWVDSRRGLYKGISLDSVDSVDSVDMARADMVFDTQEDRVNGHAPFATPPHHAKDPFSFLSQATRPQTPFVGKRCPQAPFVGMRSSIDSFNYQSQAPPLEAPVLDMFASTDVDADPPRVAPGKVAAKPMPKTRGPYKKKTTIKPIKPYKRRSSCDAPHVKFSPFGCGMKEFTVCRTVKEHKQQLLEVKQQARVMWPFFKNHDDFPAFVPVGTDWTGKKLPLDEKVFIRYCAKTYTTWNKNAHARCKLVRC
jgi:hypothetical protein